MISMSTKKFPLDEATCGVYIPSQNGADPVIMAG